jgi:hypothetical protein
MGRSQRDEGCIFRGIAYSPLPSQARFHRSQARFKGFSGPIGSGKSQALCQEAIKLTYVNPGRTGLLGAPTYPMLRDATQTTLFEILETNGLPFEHNKGENTLTMRDTRSRVLFRAVEEFDRLRGTNLAWFGLDELTYTQEDAWLVLEGRLRDSKAERLCGFAAWTPKGFDWVYRRFLLEPVPGYDVAIAKAFENRHLLERIPDFYERLKRSYDEQFYRQEALGEYLSLGGSLVYRAFNRAEHVMELSLDRALPLHWALDFNVDPMCSVVAQIAGGTVRVLDEIVISRASTLDACEEFRGRFPRHAAGISIYGDASGARMQTAGTSDWMVIREFFHREGYRDVTYKVPKSNPPVRERVELVNAKLKSASGEVKLVVNRKCKELVKDFEQVSYKPDTMLIDKDGDPRRTHLSDALGYLVWQECRAAVAGERPERLI